MDKYIGEAAVSDIINSLAQGTRPQTISGLYQGEMILPQPGRFVLELRVDVDPRNIVSPVMNRVSGDLYQVTRTNLPGQPSQTARTYIESWIIDQPALSDAADHVDITGDVRFWIGTHPATTAALSISWPGSPPAVSAKVTFTETGGSTREYNCRRSSDSFRKVNFEIDVCASVNRPPLLPTYDTTWHDDRPASAAPGADDRVELPGSRRSRHDRSRSFGGRRSCAAIRQLDPCPAARRDGNLFQPVRRHLAELADVGADGRPVRDPGRRRRDVRRGVPVRRRRQGARAAGLCRLP